MSIHLLVSLCCDGDEHWCYLLSGVCLKSLGALVATLGVRLAGAADPLAGPSIRMRAQHTDVRANSPACQLDEPTRADKLTSSRAQANLFDRWTRRNDKWESERTRAAQLVANATNKHTQRDTIDGLRNLCAPAQQIAGPRVARPLEGQMARRLVVELTDGSSSWPGHGSGLCH